MLRVFTGLIFYSFSLKMIVGSNLKPNSNIDFEHYIWVLIL